MTNIVCYMGGCCGDLVAAMFDKTDCVVRHSAVMLPSERTKLKKPHLFASDSEKDQYIDSCKNFASIVSHDIEYHLRKNHEFITVAVTNFQDALWAAKRFKHLHRPHVWNEMVAGSGANTIEQYAEMMLDYTARVTTKSNLVINLTDIIDGNLLDILSPIVEITEGKKKFYANWISVQHFSYDRSMQLLRRGFVVGA